MTRHALLASLLAALLFGCPAAPEPSDDDDTSSDDDDDATGDDDDDDSAGDVVELNEATVVLADLPGLQSATLDGDQVTIVVSGDAATLGIEVGSILLSTEAGGFLRRVEELSTEGGVLEASTAQATLPEAFDRLLAGFTVQNDAERSLVELSRTWTSGLLTLELSGQVDPSFTVDLGFDVDWTGVHEAHFVAATGLELSIEASGTVGAAGEWDEEATVFTTSKVPFTWGHLAGRTWVEVEVGVEAEAAGQVVASCGVSAGAGIEAGVQYTGVAGWETIWEPDLDWAFDPPSLEVDVSGSIRPWVQVEMHVELYGAADVSLGPRGYALAEAHLQGGLPEWTLGAGLDGLVELEVEVLGVELVDTELALFDWYQVLATSGPLMAQVPSGDFAMGCAPTDTLCDPDEEPRHDVYLSDYWIDLLEVTNDEYALFLGVHGNDCGGVECVDAEDPNVQVYEEWGWWWPLAGYEQHPVIEVSWNGARDYCAWRDKRLPTEAEWEKAARGTDGRIFPWGDQEADCSLAIMWDPEDGTGCGQSSAWPVGSREDGASPYGLLDMAGNVWEWVSDWYEAEAYVGPEVDPEGPDEGEYKVVRGGGWALSSESHRSSNREAYPVAPGNPLIGFRCASELGPGRRGR